MTPPASPMFALCDQAVDRLAAADPIMAGFCGVDGYSHAWTDLSPQANAERLELWRTLAAEARATPVEDDRDRLAQQVLIDEAELWARWTEVGNERVSLNNLASPAQMIREATDLQPAATVADWEAIIERLRTIDEPLSGYQATLDEGRRLGQVVATRQVEAVMAQAEMSSGSESSFARLRARLAEAAQGDAADAGLSDSGLAARLDEAIETAQAAYGRFGTYLSTAYLPDARPDDPVGADQYSVQAEFHLGQSIDLAETYRWGWDEVERLWSEAGAVAARIDTDRSVALVLELLATDPAYAAASAEEFIDLMSQRQNQALEQLSGVQFDVPDEIRAIEVRMAPPGGGAGAYYTPPAEDFSRPGTVWYPPAGRDTFPLFDEVTTAYHEGFPGHHLQVGLQVARADELSRFHRLMVWHPGSGEGWALYAELFMGELGYLERPEYEMGLLTSQLFRACRVVIDIGIHCGFPIPDDVSFHPGGRWTFDLAVALLAERTGMADEVIRSEVTRYMGWPGQAITYKVGERAILDLREEHSKRSGFDLKEFHSRLLSFGSVGLDLTRQLMA